MKKFVIVMFTILFVSFVSEVNTNASILMDTNNYEYVTFRNLVIENFYQINKYKYKDNLIYEIYNSYNFYSAINYIRIKHHKKPLRIELLRLIFLQWIEMESGFNKNAISKSGCYGLLQIKYSVWKKHFKLKSYKQLFNYRTNIRISKNIFIKYLEKSNGNFYLALKYYNEGPFSNSMFSQYSNVIISNAQKKLNKLYIFFND